MILSRLATAAGSRCVRSGALDLVVGRDDGNVELWGLGDAAVAPGMSSVYKKHLPSRASLPGVRLATPGAGTALGTSEILRS